MDQLLPFPTAGELISKKNETVVSIAPGASVLAAVETMAETDVGFLPVIENGRLAGVLSERDCTRRVVLGNLPAATTAVRDIMTAQVHSVPPETRVPECIVLMHDAGIRHLPVMRGREIVGVLSVRDLMGALIERQERLLRRLNEERLQILYPDPSSY